MSKEQEEKIWLDSVRYRMPVMSINDPDVIIDKCEHYDGSFDEEDEDEQEELREEEEYYDDEEYYEDNTETSKQENTGKAKRRLADRKRFRTCLVSKGR